MKSRITFSLGLLAVCVMFLMSALPAVAAPGIHLNSGKELNPKACDADGAPLINVNFKVINDADSGVAGNAWAMDSYNKHIQVWAQDDGSFCAIVKYDGGKFVTLAGPSPQNTGTLGAGIKGTFEGGYRATFDGTFAPTMKTKGNLGTFDYACTGPYTCPGAFDWISAYFTGNTMFDQPYWAWLYKAGKNGTWLNALAGNQGDITGN